MLCVTEVSKNDQFCSHLTPANHRIYMQHFKSVHSPSNTMNGVVIKTIAIMGIYYGSNSIISGYNKIHAWRILYSAWEIRSDLRSTSKKGGPGGGPILGPKKPTLWAYISLHYEYRERHLNFEKWYMQSVKSAWVPVTDGTAVTWVRFTFGLLLMNYECSVKRS